MAKRARLAQLAGLLADGVLTETSVRDASVKLRREVAEIEAQMADAGRADVLGPLIAADDVASAWAAGQRLSLSEAFAFLLA